MSTTAATMSYFQNPMATLSSSFKVHSKLEPACNVAMTTSPELNSPLPSTPTSSPSSVAKTKVPAVIPSSLPLTPTTAAAGTEDLLSVPTLTEALKYDPFADAHYSKRRKTMSGPFKSKNTKQQKRIVFRETVQVLPIPMRNEYSSRVRSRLWTGAAELYQNSARNTVEFASEGWNWRDVAEDELMHVCVATGELIHPCHYSTHYKNQACE